MVVGLPPSFTIGMPICQGTVKWTEPDVVRMWRQWHGSPASGGGIERVLPSAGKQYDALKKRTMDKTLESTLKEGINTKLPTCDDKGFYCGQHVGSRKGAEETVGIWTDSVALVWFVWFVNTGTSRSFTEFTTQKMEAKRENQSFCLLKNLCLFYFCSSPKPVWQSVTAGWINIYGKKHTFCSILIATSPLKEG